MENITKNHITHYFLLQSKKEYYDVSEKFIKNKFRIIKRLLIKNNTFYQVDKNILFTIFEKSQRAAHGFYLLKKIMRNKMIKKHKHDQDLNFNNLSDIPSNKKVSIIDSNIIYTFSLYDLVNIINNSLSYHYDYFPEPATIKNPFTNLEFSFGALINIYHAFENSTIKTPLLFERYYNTFFNIDLFEKENESLIREYLIKRFMKNSSIDDKSIDFDFGKSRAFLVVEALNLLILPRGVHVHKKQNLLLFW